MTVSAEAVNLQIPADVHAAIQEIAKRTSREFSEVANEMLSEAVKMRRVPGILFADGPIGRRARVGGTGIEVFEVIRSYRGMDENWERLQRAYHWLSERQLQKALEYAAAFPDEINFLLRDDDREEEVLEELWAAHPETKPRYR